MNVSQFILKVVFPFRFYLLSSSLVIFLICFDSMLRSYLVKLLIDAVSNNNMQEALRKTPLLLGLYFFGPIMWRIQDWCALRYEPELKKYTVQTAFNHLTLHDAHFFQNQLAGSLASKINDLANVSSLINIVILHYLGNIITAFIAAIMLWQVSYLLTVSIIIWAIFAVTLSLYSTSKFNSLTRIVSEAASKCVGSIVDSITNILNIQLFASRSEEIKRLETLQKQYVDASKKRRWYILNFYSLQALSYALYQACSLGLLVYLYSKGKITPGDFAMILMVNSKLIESLWQMSEKVREVSEIWGMLEQALSTIYMPLAVQDKPNASDFKAINGHICFNSVYFHYKGNIPLFKNLNVEILPGQKVGVVGYSGSGKTTFAYLITRIYDINSGQILIDNQNIQDVTKDSLRASIAIVPQDPSLFHRTLLENIKYGKFDATHNKVEKAAKLAHIDNLITKLPHGYNSLVGERGIKLSGGQRQRIALARAFLQNAPILILDEATSQLDSFTEKYIQDAMANLMKDKTTIVIAHRLSTLLQMDRILVFKSGEIVEDGTHQDLLSKNELYKTLWDTQVGGFILDREIR